jgi:hypothetical protein
MPSIFENSTRRFGSSLGLGVARERLRVPSVRLQSIGRNAELVERTLATEAARRSTGQVGRSLRRCRCARDLQFHRAWLRIGRDLAQDGC